MSLVLQEINKQYIATNNGLEQVYQNKLVEGVDFERYDWLRGDGVAYILTGYRDFGKNKINFRLRNQQPDTYKCEFGVETYPTNIDYARFLIRIFPTSYTIYPADNISNTYQYAADIYNITWESNYVTVNSQRHAMRARKTIPALALFGYSSWNGTEYKISTSRNKNVEYNYFVINGVFDMHPCQLLRDIPANLDSQGVARSAGTCGMIEELTGIFYTNANTTGAFSVYNDPVTE